MQTPVELFDNSEKLKEFKEALEREGYIANLLTGALVLAAILYKNKGCPREIFTLLTKYTFVYNFHKKKHIWISTRSSPSCSILCLYMNMKYIKEFFGIDIGIGFFKKTHEEINTQCVEQTMSQLRVITNMQWQCDYF